MKYLHLFSSALCNQKYLEYGYWSDLSSWFTEACIDKISSWYWFSHGANLGQANLICCWMVCRNSWNVGQRCWHVCNDDGALCTTYSSGSTSVSCERRSCITRYIIFDKVILPRTEQKKIWQKPGHRRWPKRKALLYRTMFHMIQVRRTDFQWTPVPNYWFSHFLSLSDNVWITGIRKLLTIGNDKYMSVSHDPS